MAIGIMEITPTTMWEYHEFWSDDKWSEEDMTDCDFEYKYIQLPSQSISSSQIVSVTLQTIGYGSGEGGAGERKFEIGFTSSKTPSVSIQETQTRYMSESEDLHWFTFPQPTIPVNQTWYLYINQVSGDRAYFTIEKIQIEYEEDSTILYGVNGAWVPCIVYYGVNNQWVKCTPYYGSGGKWVPCSGG